MSRSKNLKRQTTRKQADRETANIRNRHKRGLKAILVEKPVVTAPQEDLTKV